MVGEAVGALVGPSIGLPGASVGAEVGALVGPSVGPLGAGEKFQKYFL